MTASPVCLWLMCDRKGNHKDCPYGRLLMGLGGLELGEGDVVGYVLEDDFEGHADDQVFRGGVVDDDVGGHDGSLFEFHQGGYEGDIPDEAGVRRAMHYGVGVEGCLAADLPPLGVAREGDGQRCRAGRSNTAGRRCRSAARVRVPLPSASTRRTRPAALAGAWCMLWSYCSLLRFTRGVCFTPILAFPRQGGRDSCNTLP